MTALYALNVVMTVAGTLGALGFVAACVLGYIDWTDEEDHHV